MRLIRKGVIGLFALVALSIQAQTNITFTRVTATPEGTIQIAWTSVSNETYEIQEADALQTNTLDGVNYFTTWNTLYTDYPSQGTNTFWLDTGNYLATPAIVSSKNSPMRFYRVMDLGPDSTPDEPIVSVVNLTNNSVVSGNLIIKVDTTYDQATAYSKLYVDGQEMNPAIDSTNISSDGTTNVNEATYFINTCEWLNGNHVIFATAEQYSALQGPSGGGPTTTGHAVSSFVNQTFSNLVTGISFSQPFFDPSSGQIQTISATFNANVNWTLNVVDIDTNTVFTTNGSGGTMAYNWDGKGTGETTLPIGVYHYDISAATNGLPITSGFGGGGGGGGSGPPSPEFARGGGFDTLEIALPPLPPGLTYDDGADTMTILVPQHSTAALSRFGGGGFTPDDAGAATDPQSSGDTPDRPPTAPVNGIAGTFGIAFDAYLGNGTNGYNVNSVQATPGITGPKIHMDGDTLSLNSYYYGPLGGFIYQAAGFAHAMIAGGYQQGFFKSDPQFTLSDLKASGSFLNTANLAVLITHGSYGNGADNFYGGTKQIYFPITAGTSASYMRFSDMFLGGSGSAGLKWICMNSCFSLKSGNFTSFINDEFYTPASPDLHMILGYQTFGYTETTILSKWATYMTVGKTTISSNGVSHTPPMTIKAAWNLATSDAYNANKSGYAIEIQTAVSSDSACTGDYLKTNSPPAGGFWSTTQDIAYSP